MLLLGIDTSGKSGGITLAEGDAHSFRALESCPIAGGTFSAQLVPTIAGLLGRHGHSVQDLDGFAVASGPGSFTGLRVGLSAVKGLAEVLNKPIVTVSLLEALAVSSGRQGRIAAALDAGRSEVFWGVYQVSASTGVPAGHRKISEELLSREEFLEHLGNSSLDHAITGDAALADLALSAPAQGRVHAVARPSSEMIARIGLRKLLAGETVSVEALDATYIRRSDAELFSKGVMIRVRAARAKDVPRMMEIAGHSATAADWNQEAYLSLFAPGAPPGLVTLVIEENDAVVGFLVSRMLVEGEWEIHNVAVAGAARRRGLGSRLMGEFMDLAHSRGGRHIFLEVRASNRAARALYEKWAFVEAGARRSYYQEPLEDALILRFTFPQDR